jgi:hypothetical protein
MQSPDPRLTDGSQDTTAQSDVTSQPAPEDGRTRPKPSRTLVASAAVLILVSFEPCSSCDPQVERGEEWISGIRSEGTRDAHPSS